MGFINLQGTWQVSGQGKNLTIEEVAKGLMTTRKTLSAIINGKHMITPEMSLKLAKAFNTSIWLDVLRPD